MKPYCLLVPALAPAASAGLRLLRAAVRASLRGPVPLRERPLLRPLVVSLAAGLEPFEWPLRLLHEAEAGFAERVPLTAGRLAAPLVRVPFDEPA